MVIRWPTLRTSISERPGSVSCAAVRRGVGPVGVEAARKGLAALADILREVALHQAEPVAVDHDLVLGIDGGDRILAVLDGGQRRFQHDIGDAGRIGLADRVGAVDDDLDMQAVVARAARASGAAGAPR